MLHWFAPETVELIHYDGQNLTFRSRRKRKHGRQKVRLLLAVASRLEKLDLPVAVESARPVEGGTECSGLVEIPPSSARSLDGLLRAVKRAGADRRRSPRKPVNLHVRSRQLAGFSGRTVDVSQHGLQLAVAGPVAPGSLIEVALDLQPELALAGQVAWSRQTAGGWRLGLELGRQSPTQRRALEYLLEGLAL